MFVGHAVLAFVVVAAAAVAVGTARRTALRLGVVAGLFATVPDVDMVYAVAGLLDGGDVFAMADGFWRASTVAHRGVTHSLVVGLPAAVAFGLVGTRSRVAAVVLGALVVVAAVSSGPLAATVTALFAGGGWLVGRLGTHWGLPTRAQIGAAVVGVLTHPFGDVFTGTPPAFLYPLEGSLLADRVGPFADPTLDLLLAFGVELAVLWAGVIAVAWLTNRSVRRGIDRRAGVAAAYGVAAIVLTPPTMAASYQFVFSVLALGVVGAVPHRQPLDVPDPWETVVTGLAAITVGGLAYTVTYLLVGA